MPPRPQTRLYARERNARNDAFLRELTEPIDFLTDRINRFDIFIQNHPNALDLQRAINDRNRLHEMLIVYTIRLANYYSH